MRSGLKYRFVMKRILIALATTVALLFTADAAPEKGWFGFHIDVKTAGFVLNPTVASVTILDIAPNSPAAGQHINAGDEIVEAEGKPVPGARALQLKPLLTKSPGEVLHLRLKRKDGEVYSVTLTAAKKPA